MKYKIEIDNAGCMVIKKRKRRAQWKECAWINEKSFRIFFEDIPQKQKKKIDKFLRKKGIKVNSQGYVHK